LFIGPKENKLPRVQVPEKAEPKAPDNKMKEIEKEEASKPSDLDLMNENHCLIRCKILGT
jgi:hypothetical protein